MSLIRGLQDSNIECIMYVLNYLHCLCFPHFSLLVFYLIKFPQCPGTGQECSVMDTWKSKVKQLQKYSNLGCCHGEHIHLQCMRNYSLLAVHSRRLGGYKKICISPFGHNKNVNSLRRHNLATKLTKNIYYFTILPNNINLD